MISYKNLFAGYYVVCQGCGVDSYSKTGDFSINFREEVDSKELYPYEGELPAISMKQSLEVKHNEC